MNRTIVARWATLLVLSSAASAQSKWVLGRENAAFARSLFEGRYPDLATQMCEVISKNGASPTEALEIKALGFELDLDRAGRLDDLAARRATLNGIIEAENAFIKENARTSVADVVRANLPNVYLELATALTAALQKETDAGKRAELTQEGEKIFDEAKKTLRDRVERFTKVLAEGTGNQDYAQRQHMIASFNLAKMDYQHAGLYAKGSPEKQALLEAALGGFQDFGLEYQDSGLNYQGIIYQGLCHEDLGLDEDALVDFEDTVTSLREQFDRDEKGVYQVGPDEADLISGATLNRVELLTRMKRTMEAVGVAQDFLDTTPDALLTSSGLRVLAAKAEAERQGGDISGASASAQTLVDFDLHGWAGRKGREILGNLPIVNLAPDKILRIAETTYGRGEFSRALDLCRRARETVRGARDEQEIGAAAYYLAGSIYRSQKKLNEASMAFDLAAELYPKGSMAPEALYAAVNVYGELARKDNKARFYSRRADERMNALATKYPTHEKAANAGIWQGRKLEEDGDFAGAIQFYSQIEPSSPIYFEASLRTANATYAQAQALAQSKPEEGAAQLEKAEQLFLKTIELVKKGQEETLDAAVRQRLVGYETSARLGLGSVLIDRKRGAEVQKLLEGLDERVASNPDLSASVWSLRIRALQSVGKVDEALRLFESLIQRTPDAPGIAPAAGVLARALDESASATEATDAKAAEAQWRKAAQYYELSVKGALSGTAPLVFDNVFTVAQRLYAIGLNSNKVPQDQYTFVDWQGEVIAPDLWEKALAMYERLDAQAPNYRVTIELARTLAILGRLADAETIYARLFDQVSLFDQAKPKFFDRSVVESRPELVSAYLEWGVVTHLVALGSNDAARLDRAGAIYTRMLENSVDDSRTWWQAKYFQIRLASDRGEYELADTGIRNVKRTNSADYDKGKYGFQDKFKALEAELAKKVFNRPKPAPETKKPN